MADERSKAIDLALSQIEREVLPRAAFRIGTDKNEAKYACGHTTKYTIVNLEFLAELSDKGGGGGFAQRPPWQKPSSRRLPACV